MEVLQLILACRRPACKHFFLCKEGSHLLGRNIRHWIKLNFETHSPNNESKLFPKQVNNLEKRNSAINFFFKQRDIFLTIQGVRAMHKNTNGDCVESVCSDSDLKPKAAVQTKMDSFGFGFDSDLATKQLALFCYTSGVSFVCFENPHNKEIFRLLNAGCLPPSQKHFQPPCSMLKKQASTNGRTFAFPRTYKWWIYRHSSRKSYQVWSFDQIWSDSCCHTTENRSRYLEGCWLYCLENRKLCSSTWWHWKSRGVRFW